MLSYIKCAIDIGTAKVIAFEQQRLAGGLGQGVRKAIAEVQLSRMTATSAKISVGLPGDPLRFGDGFDDNFCLCNQFIEAAAGNRITTAIDNERGFDKAGGRDPTIRAVRDRVCASSRLWLSTKDSDQRRG